MRRGAWVIVIVIVACGGGGGGGGGGNGNGDGGGGGGDAPVNQTAQQFCVSETNRYRAMNSVAALAESAALEAYATIGAMVDYGSSPHNHFSSTNGGGIAFAENECPGQFGWHLTAGESMTMLVAQCIAAFYAEGPGTDYSTHGHYINMMNPSYTKLGCGIYQAANMDVTIVQDYGN